MIFFAAWIIIFASHAANPAPLDKVVGEVIAHLSKSSANIVAFSACLEETGKKATQECYLTKPSQLDKSADCVLKQGYKREVIKTPYSLKALKMDSKALPRFYDALADQQESILKLFKKLQKCPAKGCLEKKLESLRMDAINCLQ
jgi:hypothetical protein